MRDFRRGRQQHGANHFMRGRDGCRGRQDKGRRDDRGPRVIRAAGHRAGGHAAHIVAAIHGLRIVLRGCLLVVMMRLDGAEAAGAASYAIGDQRRGAQRGVQQRHRQHAEACSGRAKAFCLCPVHEGESRASCNDTPDRRVFTAGVSGRNPSVGRSLTRLRWLKNVA